VVVSPGVIEAVFLRLSPAASRFRPTLVGKDDDAETHNRQW
jgi:hypothetical protein